MTGTHEQDGRKGTGSLHRDSPTVALGERSSHSCAGPNRARVGTLARGNSRPSIAGYITELTAMQNDDGGWPSWARGRPSEAYSTIQATHSLIVARAAGYDVPEASIDRGRRARRHRAVLPA